MLLRLDVSWAISSMPLQFVCLPLSFISNFIVLIFGVVPKLEAKVPDCPEPLAVMLPALIIE